MEYYVVTKSVLKASFNQTHNKEYFVLYKIS